MKHRWATNYFARARGLLGSNPIKEVLVLTPCKSVHTFGMKYDLDVAFVDKEGTVLAVYHKVKPNTIVRQRGAALVLERYHDQSPWFQMYQKVGIKPL